MPVHPLFWLQESCKQCCFSLIVTGAVGKNKKTQYIPYRDILKTQCLLLSVFDMYMLLALLILCV